MDILREVIKNAWAWLTRDEMRSKTRMLRESMVVAFTEHPRMTGETYWQHLWFTIGMGVRLCYAMLVLLIHGVFPFLLTRAASTQIEAIYRIITARIPKARRDEIDLDYCV